MDASSGIAYGLTSDPAGHRIELFRSFTRAGAGTVVNIGSPASVTIHGGDGIVGPGLPAPGAPDPIPGDVSVAWHATPDVVISLSGFHVARDELLSVANGLIYRTGAAGPEVKASPPGTAAPCRMLPEGAIDRAHVVAQTTAATAGEADGPTTAKLVRLADLMAVDPNMAECFQLPCPEGVLVWMTLTPLPFVPEGGVPVVGAASPSPRGPGWQLLARDAHTGAQLNVMTEGSGHGPGYWNALIDFGP